MLACHMHLGTDDRRADALAAGKKRSVKDRLGVRKGGGGGDGHGMHRNHDVVSGKCEAEICSEGFVKYFLRVPHAVRQHCSCQAAQASKKV